MINKRNCRVRNLPGICHLVVGWSEPHYTPQFHKISHLMSRTQCWLHESHDICDSASKCYKKIRVKAKFPCLHVRMCMYVYVCMYVYKIWPLFNRIFFAMHNWGRKFFQKIWLTPLNHTFFDTLCWRTANKHCLFNKTYFSYSMANCSLWLVRCDWAPLHIPELTTQWPPGRTHYTRRP